MSPSTPSMRFSGCWNKHFPPPSLKARESWPAVTWLSTSSSPPWVLIKKKKKNHLQNRKKSPTDCEITYLIFNAFSPWKSMPPRDWPAREAGLSGTNSCQWADDPMALGDFKVPTRKSQERATTQLCLNLLVLKVGWTLESRGEWSKLLMVGDPGFNVQI